MNFENPMRNLDLTIEEERKVAFLISSTQLDGIENIDYTDPILLEETQGHYGALCQALKLGKEHIPLEIENLMQWLKFIIEEQYSNEMPPPPEALELRCKLKFNNGSFAHVVSGSQVHNLLEKLIKDLNRNLSQYHSFFGPADDASSVKALADHLLRFQRILPFNMANGRLSRLLINYIGAWCHIPVMVFLPEDKQVFDNSLSELSDMRAYFVTKIREAVYSNKGKIMVQIDSDPLNSYYQNNNDRLEVQWNDLICSSQLWK